MIRKQGQVQPALRRSGLEVAVPPKELASLDKLGTPVQIDDGTRLAHQGTRGRECFLILEGEARLDRDGAEVARVGRGRFVGELAVLTGRPRSADVTATMDSLVHAFSSEEFRALMRLAPRLKGLVLEAALGKALTLTVMSATQARAAEAPFKRSHAASSGERVAVANG